jgi:tripartite motif-containing protein 71
MRSRLVSFVSVFLSVGLLCCGSSATTTVLSPKVSYVPCVGSAPSTLPGSTSTQGNWQVILTVKTTGVNFGITGIAIDRQGNLYLAEFDDSRIYKYSASGSCLAQLGERGSGAGQLEAPDKLAFDAQGNLYVTDVGLPPYESGSSGGNNRVQKFSPNGIPLAQWGTLGPGPSQFNVPVGIAVNQQGDIYVADVANHRVQELSAAGKHLIQWHTVGSGIGEDNTEIGYDLALDASGNVYVSEPHPFGPGNDRIQKFSPTGASLAQWGGSGAGLGQFDNPTGLAVDSSGNVFVVDSGNNRVEELSSTGQYVAQWNGPGFKFVSKIALDDHGSVYVSVGSQVLKLVVKQA